MPPEQTSPLSAPSVRSDLAFLVPVLLVASVLLFARLGDRALWQDEAETALLARSILVHGVPTAYDGRNLVSQEQGRDSSSERHIWLWTPWLQHYLAAGTFGLFGESTLTARAPFALLGIATLLLTYALGLQVSGDRRTARVALLLLVASVPFLLHMRQCRYYAPLCFFGTMFLLHYARVLEGRPRSHWPMAGAAVGLLLCHYVVFAGLMAATALHFAGIARSGSTAWMRARTRPLLLGWGPAALLAIPIFSLSTARTAYLDQLGIRRTAGSMMDALHHLNYYILPIALVLLAVTVVFVRNRSRRQSVSPGEDTSSTPRTLSTPREPGRGSALLYVALGVTTLFLSALMPWFFFRYYIALLPLGAVIQAVIVMQVWSWRRPAGMLLLALLICTDLVPHLVPTELREKRQTVRTLRTGDEEPERVVGGWARFSPMAAYLYEITHAATGPIEEIAAYLNEHGSPSDTVIATYGDLPLQFYTQMHVLGGLSGQDPSEYLDAEWLVLRAHTHRRGDAALKQIVRSRIDQSDYESIELGVLDTPYANRPDPTYHKFRTVREGLPRVRIWRRRAAAAGTQPAAGADDDVLPDPSRASGGTGHP